ncbi:ASCH domain-containing protein [Naasia sp. SYSU D00948]|uniref:ASCH domain-containing protein n=1 Tax=Naasia sp. SYSU D00948 TaxID=2817379 RepID=UPI0027DDBF96|nr:ASCH domain-containing protein [Naasia sp. SYSU D00948]
MPESPPAVPIDRASAEGMWNAYRERHAADTEGEGFPYVDVFGDSPSLAEELLGLVLAGTKRATASLVRDFRDDGEALPRIGEHWIVCDGSGQAALVVRTMELRLGPAESVDDAFAWDEGEGDRTRDDWLAGHSRYWSRTEAAKGRVWDPSADVVFERFRVVWPPEHAD